MQSGFNIDLTDESTSEEAQPTTKSYKRWTQEDWGILLDELKKQPLGQPLDVFTIAARLDRDILSIKGVFTRLRDKTSFPGLIHDETREQIKKLLADRKEVRPPRGPVKPWTQKDCETLLNELKKKNPRQRLDYLSIAARLGRTISSLKNALDRLRKKDVSFGTALSDDIRKELETVLDARKRSPETGCEKRYRDEQPATEDHTEEHVHKRAAVSSGLRFTVFRPAKRNAPANTAEQPAGADNPGIPRL